MPITLVEGQIASGSFNASSGSATLPAGTTAGNTVILTVDANGTLASSGITTPTGFTLASPTNAGALNKLAVYRKSNVGAGETSYTVATVGAVTAPLAWEIREYEGIDPDFPVDVAPAVLDVATAATSIEAGPTPTSTAYDGLLLVAFGINGTTTTPPTWSGHTGGVTEDTDQGAVGAAVSAGLSVASMPVQSLAAWASTATSSASGSLAATAIVFAAAGASRASNPANIWGFEWRTAAGLALGSSQQRHFESVTGTPEVVDDATKARTGSGYLRLSSTAAAENVADAARTLPSAGNPRGVVQRRCVRFDGGLPSADTVLFSTEPTSGGGSVVVRYITASGLLGCKVGTGTEVVSNAAVTADVWFAVDLRLTTTTTAHTCDWRVTYDDSTVPVDQTQATFTASAVPAGYVSRLGWTAATTPGVAVLIDDCVDSMTLGSYPLADHRIYLCAVDPAGTVTVSGSTANFGVMTANGTIGAWNATSARDAVDDWPPTLGASADGAVAVTASATDYIEFPMETVNVSGTGSIRAVKAILAIWAAAATTATCRVTGWDGTASTTLYAEFDVGADNTSTPPWIAVMWQPSGGWTQAKLDVAAIRFGSNDATPDIGPHAVGMEVAIQPGDLRPKFGDLVELNRDPVTDGILAIAVTPTLGYDATLHYEEGGTPTDVPAPGGTTTTEVINAPDAPSVNYVALYPPAEDISDA